MDWEYWIQELKLREKRTIIILLVAAAAVLALIVYLHQSRGPATGFRTVQVKRGTLQAAISATGTVEPEEVVDIGAQVAGRSGAPAVHTITAYGAPSPSSSPWRVGQDVLHPKFGPGVIVSVQGRGSDARVMVNFRQAGMKELALEYAKLTAA